MNQPGRRANGKPGILIAAGQVPGHGDELQYVTPPPLGVQNNEGYAIPTFPGLEPSAFFDLSLGPQQIQNQFYATNLAVLEVVPGTVEFSPGVLVGQLNSYPTIDAIYPETGQTVSGDPSAWVGGIPELQESEPS